MAAPGKHLSVPCKECAVIYRQSRSDQLFCSSACASRSWNASRRPPTKCARCSSVIPKGCRIYCSTTCQRVMEARHRLVIGGPGKQWSAGKEFVSRQKCEICGEPFYAAPSQILRGGGKFCSVPCRARFMATHPEYFPQTKSRRGLGGRREDLNNQYFRSSWEANWARYLNWLQSKGEIEEWSYEPDTFEFVGIRRGSKFYTPDFKIKEKTCTYYQEIKGYMDARSKTKLVRMRRYHPSVRVDLIDKAAYSSVAKVINQLIPNWEGRR